MVTRVAVAVLLASALAGCADSGEGDGVVDQSSDTVAGKPRLDILEFGLQGAPRSETFTGRFEFEDNQQYGGIVRDHAGGEDPTRSYDVSSLLPASGVYEVHVVATADPGDGDIDVWFEGDSIAAWACACPFGGYNEVLGYGSADRGGLTVRIQYDEVHQDPDEAGVAAQGFEYTLDVALRPLARAAPPGVPVLVDLAPGEALRIQNHTQAVTIYGPDDQVAATLLPGAGDFEVENGTAGGYVVIQQENGAPFEIAVEHNGDVPRDGRLLTLVEVVGGESLAGPSLDAEFQVPVHMVHMGACLTADSIAEYDWTLTDPNGEPWMEDDGTLTIQYGSCRSTWRGTPGLVAGTWALEGTRAVGQSAEFAWWYDTYQR